MARDERTEFEYQLDEHQDSAIAMILELLEGIRSELKEMNDRQKRKVLHSEK